MPVDPEVLADFVTERAKSDPNVQKIIHDVRLFDGLREHAGWRRLVDLVRADEESFLAKVAKRLMSGEALSASLQREIDYHRGFIDGAKWIVGVPEKADESLEQAAARAWRQVQVEAAHRVEQDSPYID